MRGLVQRIERAAVRVGEEVVGAADAGLLVLVGVTHDDAEADAERLAGRIARLRVFPDAAGRFDRSVLDTGGDVLVVSQFTLYGDARRGNRPSFTAAAEPSRAEPLYLGVADALRALGVARVETGRFGAAMTIDVVADGPVTILLET